jgi:TM2 domain-containing membrane protein YozV
MKQSEKKYTIAVCLSGIFGLLGIHHFYLGRWLHGILDLSMTVGAIILIGIGFEVLGYVVLGIDIVHTLIVSTLLLAGGYKDGNGDVIAFPGQELK